MIKRFQIEDIIVQDTAGITFRALDTQTDSMVAVRRFFPFGADGGGLHDEEQAAYNIAISRLSGLRHPALRAVVAGGCDPIDGIPYIATEWIEGDILQTIIDRGTLPAEVAVVLLTQSLEVCELLSHVLAEEAIWVETDLHTIVLGNEESGRGFTFWISPLKWLGGGEQSRGFHTIVTLAEEIMGWKDKVVGDEAGRGLGGWIKWLRGVPDTTPLHEVREMLAASVGAEPPPSAKHLAIKATTHPVLPSAKIGKSSSKTGWMLTIGLILLIGLAGSWWIFRPEDSSPEAVPGSSKPLSRTEEINRRAAELRTQAESGQTLKPEAKPAAAEPAVADIIPWNNTALLIENSGRTVTVEGEVKSVAESSSGKTLYLLFADASDKSTVRAGMEIKNEDPAVVRKTFESFIGKKIRVTGSLVVRATPGNSRPEVKIDQFSAIKAVD